MNEKNLELTFEAVEPLDFEPQRVVGRLQLLCFVPPARVFKLDSNYCAHIFFYHSSFLKVRKQKCRKVIQHNFLKVLIAWKMMFETSLTELRSVFSYNRNCASAEKGLKRSRLRESLTSDKISARCLSPDLKNKLEAVALGLPVGRGAWGGGGGRLWGDRLVQLAL